MPETIIVKGITKEVGWCDELAWYNVGDSSTENYKGKKGYRLILVKDTRKER